MEPKTHQQRLDDVCLSFRNDCQRALSKAINNNTRATPDGKNIIFGVTLFDPITVFGSIRHNIQIHISEISNTINL